MKSHPNIAVLQKFNPNNFTASADILSDSAVFHYFNPELPDLEGDYIGLAGFQKFFETINRLTNGTFIVNPLSVTPVGDELVVVQTKNSMDIENQHIETDVVVVWRIVDGKIREVWDIPAVFSAEATALD